jgi:hypothetical protein
MILQHQRKKVLRQYPELVGILGKEEFEAFDEITYQIADVKLLWQHRTDTSEYLLISKEGKLLAQVGRGFIPRLKTLCRLGPELVIDAVNRIMRKKGDIFGYVVSLYAEERSGDQIVRRQRMTIHQLRDDMWSLVDRALHG